MYSEFSEFSYGYALTDNILHSGLPCTSAAPFFPSLQAEGSAGGGYDVKLPLNPVPLFLQFKIPQVVERKSKAMPHGFSPPYLRMHLRTRRPNQHQLLIDLEGAGNAVFYATPNFWNCSDLDNHFTSRRVHYMTSYFRPSAIGNQDDKPHHVAYTPTLNEAWVRSTPVVYPIQFHPGYFGEHIGSALDNTPERDPVESLFSVRRTLLRILDMNDQPTGLQSAFAGESALALSREIAYLSQVHFGCTFLLAGHRNRVTQR